MDLQIFLALSSASLAAAIIGQMVITETYRVAGSMRLFAMLGLVIAVAVGGYWAVPSLYGYLAAFVLAAIYAPGLVMQRAGHAMQAGHGERAAWLARLAWLMHPSRELRFNERLFSALSEPTLGTRVAALQALGRTATPDQVTLLDLHIFRQRQDWQGLIDYVRGKNTPDMADGVLFPIRAFGETGQLDALVRTFSAHRATLGSTLMPSLVALAFCGRVEGVDACLKLFPSFAPDMRAFWRATALQAAGHDGEARALLEGIDASSLPEPRGQAIADRLQRPVTPAAGALSAAGRQFAAMLEERMKRTAELRSAGWRQTPLTWLLILANLITFGAELIGGDPTDTQNLLRLGALWPDDVVLNHEWWRLVSAMFLHAGPEHLLGNMLGLWVIGRFIEVAMGSWRMAVIYGVGGLASMLGVVGLMATGLTEPDVLVGASGAIFSLFGALAWQRFSDFRASRTVADRRNLMMIGLVLVLEAVIDLTVPQISFSAHGIGLLAGVLLGWLLRKR